MKVDLAYADGMIILDVPASVIVDTFSPVQVQPSLSFEDFQSGFSLVGGGQFLSEASPLIVVNDGYRNTPTVTILQWLDRLDNKVIDRAHFLVATGIHDAPTAKHYRRIFGPLWNRVKGNVSYHDCHDLNAMTPLGKDNLGGEVWLNKAVLDHKKILVIGSVEPHYFAGFTGGRKAIFPGLTDFATVARNHNLANSLEAAPFKLDGNPVAEHLDSLITTLDLQKFFGIQVVTDTKRKIAGLFFGQLVTAFQKAAAMAEKIYACSVSRKYDVVICEVLPPLDKNLYQAQKAVENCQAVVKDEGAVIVVSACKEGIGSNYFFELAEQWDRERNCARDGGLHFGSHKLSRVITIGKRIQVCLYSTLSNEIVRKVFYEPLDNLQTFLYLKVKECEKYHLAVVHDAANMVLKT